MASEPDFLDAVDRAEQALGLNNQPIAIVMREKESRHQAHVVWSRIDRDKMRAINLLHFENKLRDLSRDPFLAHDSVLPGGLTICGKNLLSISPLRNDSKPKERDLICEKSIR